MEKDAKCVAEFGWCIGRLKRAVRTGWVMRGVTQAESVADHSWRMAVFAFFADGWGANRDRCMRMALVHDLAEAVTGDIPRVSGVDVLAKQKSEHEAIISLVEPLRGAFDDIANEIVALWKEYDANVTDDAKFVKDLDKLEMIMQAVEYENDRVDNARDGGSTRDLSCFREAADRLEHPLSRSIAREIEALKGRSHIRVPVHY